MIPKENSFMTEFPQSARALVRSEDDFATKSLGWLARAAEHLVTTVLMIHATVR